MAIGTGIWVMLNYLPTDMSSFNSVHSYYTPPILSESLARIIIDGLPALPGEHLSPNWLDTVMGSYFSFKHYAVIYGLLALVNISIVIFRDGRREKMLLLSFVLLPIVASRFLGGFNNTMHSFACMPYLIVSAAWALYDMAKWAKTRQSLVYMTLSGFSASTACLTLPW